MKDRVDAARRRLQGSSDETAAGSGQTDKVYSPDELRQVFRKFRRLMGVAGNPGTVEIEGALRAGWIVASGPVEGYDDQIFHVVMLTNGALHYSSGEITGPIELTGKWFLGDSIPSLEAKMPDTIAEILAAHDIDWDGPTQAAKP